MLSHRTGNLFPKSHSEPWVHPVADGGFEVMQFLKKSKKHTKNYKHRMFHYWFKARGDVKTQQKY